MESGSWRRQFVHDLLFAIDGAGWHEPEMKDAIGYRWSGPGRLSMLRVAAPPGAGRGEARLLVMPGEALPGVAVFLNGHRLEVTSRRHGALGVLDFAWDAEAMAGEALGEFWFHSEHLAQVPVPSGRMRGVGFRLSTLTLTGASQGPAPAAEALALIIGRRFLVERLPVVAGRSQSTLRTEGAARLIDIRLEAARLGPTAQPQLTLALRATAATIDLAIGVPGRPPVQVLVDETGKLGLPATLSPRDRLLVARLLTCLPEAYSRALDDTMASPAPEADSLAQSRRDLSRLARAAERTLATVLSDGADLFDAEASVPFVWPPEG